MSTSPNPSDRLLFCIEDASYRAYIEASLGIAPGDFVDFDQFVFRVAENPQGILVLQSETHENDLIDMAKKLKRLFADTVRIILLSADYQVLEYAQTVVDGFLQFPVTQDELLEAIQRLAQKKRKILLIDDSKLVHKHLCPPLIEEGYETFSAMDGQEGLEMAQKILPDLIISDIEMPRMNGFETCRALRLIPELRGVPIIMSSTLGSVADQRQGFASGVDEYITKPVNIPDLVGRLDKIFKQKLAGRENVLIVEPDANIARNITTTLTKQGFSPRVCASVPAAIKILRRFTHDLVLCESEAPGGGAMELLKALPLLDASHKAGLMVLTDKDTESDVRMMKKAGSWGFIQKPFTQDSLLAGVERTLAQLKAELEKAHIEKYVSKASRKMALEKSILSGGENASRAYRKNATIFFSDIQEFTARCERYSPREIVDQINTLFSVMTRVITETGGDIDKFIGDACMAFWMDEDPQKSAAAALGFMVRIRHDLEEMNRTHPQLKTDPIRIRMGLNTGEVILCDIGAAEARIDLTMIGDTVNLAARLESGAKQYGLDNLVSGHSIHRQTGFAARSIDLIRVKGKEQPVEVFELVEASDRVDADRRAWLTAFQSGVEAYRAGQFLVAQQWFQQTQALEASPQGVNPSSVLIERCQALLATPPTAWDGVWTLSSK